MVSEHTFSGDKWGKLVATSFLERGHSPVCCGLVAKKETLDGRAGVQLYECF